MLTRRTPPPKVRWRQQSRPQPNDPPTNKMTCAMTQRFGGKWTERKLESVRKYLRAYGQIFASNERAQYFRTWYVDAFAGSGTRAQVREGGADESSEAVELLKGSVHVALSSEPRFHRYVFVEKDPAFARNLDNVANEYPDRRDSIEVVNAEANEFLQRWCHSTDWHTNRAVVFLDPYGMQVDWTTIQALGRTKAVDLWILFPLGQGVNRLLMRDKPPEGAWADRLTRFFGSTEWRDRFYRPSQQISLFGSEPELEKEADWDSIGQYFLDRLNTEFAKVAPKPLPLRNSKGVPIFLLCFAAANEKVAPTAVRIANHILKDE